MTRIRGAASFSGARTVVVDGKEYSAKHILIATGGAPNKLGDRSCIAFNKIELLCVESYWIEKNYISIIPYPCLNHIDDSLHLISSPLLSSHLSFVYLALKVSSPVQFISIQSNLENLTYHSQQILTTAFSISYLTRRRAGRRFRHRLWRLFRLGGAAQEGGCDRGRVHSRGASRRLQRTGLSNIPLRAQRLRTPHLRLHALFTPRQEPQTLRCAPHQLLTAHCFLSSTLTWHDMTPTAAHFYSSNCDILFLFLFYHCHCYYLGIDVVTSSIIKEITKEADGTLTVHTENGKVSYLIEDRAADYTVLRHSLRWTHAL